MCQWWAETFGGAVKESGFDGFFMDAVLQAKRPVWLARGWGLDRDGELDAAVIDMMQRARAVMGPDRLLIYNGFRTKASGSGEPSADGQLIDYPEYQRKLGPPKGDAVREPGTWIFRRAFKHAKVTVNIEKRERGIEWLGD